MTTLYERRVAAVRVLNRLMTDRIRASDELGADIARQLLSEARARLAQTPRDAIAVGDHAPEPAKLLFDNDWLTEKIKTDPDIECEAGPDLSAPTPPSAPEPDWKQDQAETREKREDADVEAPDAPWVAPTQPRHFIVTERVFFHASDEIRPSYGSNGLIVGFARITSDGEHFPLPGRMQHNAPLDRRQIMRTFCNDIQFWDGWHFAETGRKEDADDNEEGA